MLPNLHTPAPEGRSNVAQHFSAGSAENRRPSRGGTAEPQAQIQPRHNARPASTLAVQVHGHTQTTFSRKRCAKEFGRLTCFFRCGGASEGGQKVHRPEVSSPTNHDRRATISLARCAISFSVSTVWSWMPGRKPYLRWTRSVALSRRPTRELPPA